MHAMRPVVVCDVVVSFFLVVILSNVKSIKFFFQFCLVSLVISTFGYILLLLLVKLRACIICVSNSRSFMNPAYARIRVYVKFVYANFSMRLRYYAICAFHVMQKLSLCVAIWSFVVRLVRESTTNGSSVHSQRRGFCLISFSHCLDDRENQF